MEKVKRSGGKGFSKPPKPPYINSLLDFEELVNGNQIYIKKPIPSDIGFLLSLALALALAHAL